MIAVPRDFPANYVHHAPVINIPVLTLYLVAFLALISLLDTAFLILLLLGV